MTPCASPVRTAGVSLLEVLVAMLLGAFLVHLGLTTLYRIDAQSRRLVQRRDVALSLRVSRTVLRAELATSDPLRDRRVGTDTIAVRAFRGTGIVCGGSVSGRSVRVAYSGVRAPDPSKDSLEVTTGGGLSSMIALESTRRSSDPCPVARTPERTQEWVAATDLPPDAVLLRVFERGSYHLSGAALRYRAGAGGRQPLTPPTLDDGASRFLDRGGAVGVELVSLDGEGWNGLIESVPR